MYHAPITGLDAPPFTLSRVTPSFHISGRFHPGYSLLGRWLRRATGDVRRAEALLIVAWSGLLLLLAGGQALAWMLLQDVLEAAPRGPEATAFWLAQLGAALGYVLFGLVGFQPPIAVTCTPRRLTLRQGDRTLAIPYHAITSAEPVSVLRFHRHWRRYAATHVFVNRIPDTLLLLRTTSGPVVLGLSAGDQAALVEHLEVVAVAG